MIPQLAIGKSVGGKPRPPRIVRENEIIELLLCNLKMLTVRNRDQLTQDNIDLAERFLNEKTRI